MSHYQPSESSKPGSTLPKRYHDDHQENQMESLQIPSASRNDSNLFSLQIGEIFELKRLQQALTDKFEQDCQTFGPQAIQLDSIIDHSDIVISGNDYVPDDTLDFNDPNFRIEDWCEPDYPFDSDGNYIDPDAVPTPNNDTDHKDEEEDTNIDSSSESETKEEEEEDDDDSESEDRFIVDLSIYFKVSYEHFDFHHWLKEFGLICIKEILVYHNLQTKDMWTEDNFKPILAHPLLKRDTLLTSKIDTMLKIFTSLKRQHFAGKGVWESDGDDNNDNNRNGRDIEYKRPNKNEKPKTWGEALLKQHFENPEADYVPFKGINFKIHKMPPMPKMPPIPKDFRINGMPPMPEIPAMPTMPCNLQYHFR